MISSNKSLLVDMPKTESNIGAQVLCVKLLIFFLLGDVNNLNP